MSYDRIVSGRPSLKFYEAGLDMGWTHDPFESYRMPQERIARIYDGLVEDGRIVRLDALGTVSEVQTRVREVFSSNIDLEEIEPIDVNDRLARMMGAGSIDWDQAQGGAP